MSNTSSMSSTRGSDREPGAAAMPWRIGIIGAGFVGSAMLESFRRHGIAPVVYDKGKALGAAEDCLACDILFLALPTPCPAASAPTRGVDGDKSTEYDLSAVHEVCAYLCVRRFEGLVVLKSTLVPGTTEMLAGRYAPLRLMHNPEFLSTATAARDFHEQAHIVLGHLPNVSREAVAPLCRMYRQFYPRAALSLCSSRESEMMKIGCNAFYAVKVQFFNEIYALCRRQGIDYGKVRALMLGNDWIHEMHTRVPGTDGSLSYGGMCLPKDARALLGHMREIGTPHRVLQATVEEQRAMRTESGGANEKESVART